MGANSVPIGVARTGVSALLSLVGPTLNRLSHTV